MASRRKGRILAFQALYSWDTAYSQTGNAALPEGLLDFSWTGKNQDAQNDEDGASDFPRLLVSGTVENIKAVDEMIKSRLEHWDMSRLNRVDLAILRMSVYALMYQNEIAPSITINEAIAISREFGTADSYRFVNGVLDSIRIFLEEKNKNGH